MSNNSPLAHLIKPRIISKNGFAVVNWERVDYLGEGYRQLFDLKFYQRLDQNPTKPFTRVVANKKIYF